MAGLFRQESIECDVTMIAHGKWTLLRHTEEPEVKFNILYGHYDYVVLQEYGQPFQKEETYFASVRKLNKLIQKAGSRPVIYMTWAKKTAPEYQDRMNAAGRSIASEIGALLAPVGEYWWDYSKAHPELDMYYVDGGHASIHGSRLAAKVLHDTIKADMDS